MNFTSISMAALGLNAAGSGGATTALLSARAIGNSAAPISKTAASPLNPSFADFGVGRSSRRWMRCARVLLDSTMPMKPNASVGRLNASLAISSSVAGYVSASPPMATITISSTACSRTRRMCVLASQSRGCHQ